MVFFEGRGCPNLAPLLRGVLGPFRAESQEHTYQKVGHDPELATESCLKLCSRSLPFGFTRRRARPQARVAAWHRPESPEDLRDLRSDLKLPLPSIPLSQQAPRFLSPEKSSATQAQQPVWALELCSIRPSLEEKNPRVWAMEKKRHGQSLPRTSQSPTESPTEKVGSSLSHRRGLEAVHGTKPQAPAPSMHLPI